MRASIGLSFLLSLLPASHAINVYLAGDSTMALNGAGAGTGTDGWGQYLQQYLSGVTVVNDAIGGRSARSYSDQGRFTTIINSVKSGDYVIIEFGHNDGWVGSPDNGNQEAVSDNYADTATVTTSAGASIVIHSYAYYVQNAVTSLLSKGAIPIISSVTPDNIWSNGVVAAGGRFVGYASDAASRTGVTYIDHSDYVAQAYNKLGQTTVTTYFPNDHTHTSPTGANVVAQAFVRGLLCSSNALKSKVNALGQAVPNGCL